MKKESFINKWVSCVTLYYQDKFQTIDNTSLVHPDFHNVVKDRSINTIFQCISIDGDYLELKAGNLIVKVKPEAIKKVYPDPEFHIGDVVTYNSSKKGQLILTINRLIWHDKEQTFLFFGLLNAKEYKKRFSGSELTLFNFTSLSKTISHALRHSPEEYNLRLLEGGWILIEDLLNSISEKEPYWKGLNITIIQALINQSDKERHEINGEFIRAKYGHTTSVELNFSAVTPPQVLYHGTSRESAKRILIEGLKRMDRQYIHLSPQIEEAERVGKRKDSKPILLRVDAKLAYQNGVSFYKGNDKIWLSDEIPAEFIKMVAT